MSISLSVVVITFNEEANIGRCLAALVGVADEVVVVDSFSTDKTVEICEAHGARVVQNVFAGYVEQKNFATAQASFDHVLQLDADEVLTDSLKAEIIALKANWTAAGYTMPRLTSYCGRWVRHGGWYPDRKLRLYDRRQGRWTGLLVHERYELEAGATIGALRSDLLHYSYYSVEQHVSQLNKYTSLNVAELTMRGKTKVAWWQLLLKPIWKFVHGYFIRLGFLDGFVGFCIAVLSAWSVFLRLAKLKIQAAAVKQ